jgi:hypothetical protein
VFADVQKLLQMSTSILADHRECSPLFAQVGDIPVSVSHAFDLPEVSRLLQWREIAWAVVDTLFRKTPA